MAGVIKTRSNVSITVTGRRRSSQFVGWSNYSVSGPMSTETSVGFNHSWLNGRWSGGGPWRLTRVQYTYVPGMASGGTYDGKFIISSSTTGVVAPSEYSHPSDAEQIVMGTHAIAATIPTNPIADLAVSLAELRREGLPSPLLFNTWRERTLRARNAGDEYLNNEFGWAPLVREINNFARSVSNSDAILDKYQREANRPIKRSFEFPVEEDTTWQPSAYVCEPSNFGFATGSGQITRRTKRAWFEGEYIYYLPTGGRFSDKMQRYGAYARKLLGLELTPEVLWNLTPWSWAADWYGNTGEILHNLSAFRQDGLVLRHAYIMCHTYYNVFRFGVAKGQSVSRTEVREIKTRLPATPYGFGVAYDGLSAKQVAVLAALGMSRW